MVQHSDSKGLQHSVSQIKVNVNSCAVQKEQRDINLVHGILCVGRTWVVDTVQVWNKNVKEYALYEPCQYYFLDVCASWIKWSEASLKINTWSRTMLVSETVLVWHNTTSRSVQFTGVFAWQLTHFVHAYVSSCQSRLVWTFLAGFGIHGACGFAALISFLYQKLRKRILHNWYCYSDFNRLFRTNISSKCQDILENMLHFAVVKGPKVTWQTITRVLSGPTVKRSPYDWEIASSNPSHATAIRDLEFWRAKLFCARSVRGGAYFLSIVM